MKNEEKRLTTEHIEQQSKKYEQLYQEYICIEDNNEDDVHGKKGDIQSFLKESFDDGFISKRDMFWAPYDRNSNAN